MIVGYCKAKGMLGKGWRKGDLIERQKKNSPETSGSWDYLLALQSNNYSDSPPRFFFIFTPIALTSRYCFVHLSLFICVHSIMATHAGHESTRRGALIVVEGLDRAGKSSQCERLGDYLSEQGHTVKYIRFPGTLIIRLNGKGLVTLTHAQTEQPPLGSL